MSCYHVIVAQDLGKINEVQNGMKLRVQGKMANTERIPNLN